MTLTETQGSNLSKLLVELNITPYMFSKKLGYKSPDSIYAILNGQSGFSGRFFERLEEAYPNINFGFLLHGYGEKFINKMVDTSYGTGVAFFPAELSYDHLKSMSIDILERVLLLDEGHSFLIRARRALTRGVEFEITEYGVEEDSKALSKIFNVMIMPDWQIGALFDHWSIFKPENISQGRCQNLKDFNPDYLIALNNIIFEFHKWVEDTGSYRKTQIAHLKSDQWIEIYCNDARIKELPFSKVLEEFDPSVLYK